MYCLDPVCLRRNNVPKHFHVLSGPSLPAAQQCSKVIHALVCFELWSVLNFVCFKLWSVLDFGLF